MRIHVSRTGGFAGIARQGAIDTSERADAAEWEELARSALADAGNPRPVVPDGFSYAVTVGDRTFRCADPHLTEAQRRLVSRVLGEGA
ncbi:protealysin inhibitor emfourin [uncultured Streptomyces sp.]|uniref:protealysin inhibitor emfourin n=1 Tax=uncultured Streptomyces sp. TaxID=174707 RepID=UPI002616EA58|nr:protealysin inhibitor emfourin [uncultured Streptomyces sp.]